MRRRAAGRPRRISAAGLGLTAALTALAPRPAPAGETDYLPDNAGWNGATELADLFGAAGVPVELVDELAWQDVPPGSTLLVLYPRSPLDPEHLVAFLDAGGRLLLADDFGAGGPALDALGIRRSHAGEVESDRYHDGNPALPVATAGPTIHATTAGVEAIVTNHPAMFESRLPTLAHFGVHGRQLLVAARMARGGRMVALSDPSALINCMLRFPGNLALARNLARHLRPRADGRVILLTQSFRTSGTPRPADAADRPPGELQAFLTEYSQFLGRINDFAPVDPALRAYGIMAAGLAALALVLFLPFPRRALSGHWLRPDGVTRWGGAAAAPNAGVTATSAALLRDEVDEALTEALQAPGPVLTMHPKWVLRRARELGGPDAARSCSKLLAGLRRLSPSTAADAERLGRVSQADLERLYELSRELFTALGIEPFPAVSSDLRSSTTPPQATATDDAGYR